MDRETRSRWHMAPVLLVLALLSPAWSAARAAAPALPPEVESLCLPPGEDALPGHLLQDDSLPWRTRATGQLQYGFTSDTCWIRWQMPAHTADDQPDPVLVVDDPMLADIRVFQQQGSQPFTSMRAGTDHPWSARPLRSLRPAFPLDLASEQPTTILVEARSPHSLRLPIRLESEAALAEQEQQQLLLQAGFTGAMLVMMVWHGVLFLSLRQRAHLLYLGWLASASLFALTLNGVTQRFLWPEWPVVSGHVALVLLPLMITFPARFTSDFLHLPERAPVAAKRLQRLAVMGLVLLVLAAFLGRYLMVPVIAVGAVITVSVSAWSAWQQARAGDEDAQAFLAGWAVLMVGGLLMGITRFGLIAPNQFADNLFQVGLMMQVSLLALTMAAQMRGLDSARREAEQSSREAESLRQHAINEARSRFLATVSHQFRAPMNGILGMAELLRRSDHLEQHSRQQADTIYQAARSLMVTLNDLLDYSSIQSGRVKLDIRRMELDEIISDVVDLFAAAVERKHVALHCFVESRVPPGITSDPARIKQIFINLLSNAVKHTEKGEININISVRDQHPDGQVTLLVEISDTGEGINEDTLAAIRDGVYRRDRGGIGLEVTSELVRLMGGELSIESTPGKGSQVAFTLRCQPAPVGRLPLAEQRLLVIAEQRAMRLSIGQLVRLWGMDARESLLADLPKQMSDDWQPDALVLDQSSYLAMMAATDDSTLDHVPWVVLENTDSGQRENGNGRHRFIPLPLRPLTLRNTLVELLGERLSAGARAQQHDSHGLHPGLSVLVVDDDQVSQMVISSLLQSLSATVQVAGSGREALALFQGHPTRWPVVFMDCEMPGMNGFDAMTAIRREEQAQGLPPAWIVALTAHTDSATEEKARASGVNDFLAKPVSRQQLSGTLLRAQQHRARVSEQS